MRNWPWLHTDTFNHLAIGTAAQKDEQRKRLALEQRLAASDNHSPLRLCLPARSLASPDVRLPVLLEGPPGSLMNETLTPAAWFMELHEPDLNRHMIRELSQSSPQVTGD